MQSLVYAQNQSDYLILQSIGQYSSSGKGRCGEGSGIIGTADHFDEDHNVTTCRTGYYFMQQDLAVSIKVEQHADGDSDRWLLHEVDMNFRNYYGMPSDSYRMMVINGNTIMAVRTGGGRYQWLSSNKVIQVSYTDLQLAKPQPLEVVQAYLAKHPSTLAPITSADLRKVDNETKWIKDEIDRRLWLCDKWNAQFQAGGVTQADLIYNLARSMKVFLNYRQKYYAVAAEADLNLLAGYQENKDIASIQTKLSQYKGWWSENKGSSIKIKG